jgi:hypothetical protein
MVLTCGRGYTEILYIVEKHAAVMLLWKLKIFYITVIIAVANYNLKALTQ